MSAPAPHSRRRIVLGSYAALLVAMVGSLFVAPLAPSASVWGALVREALLLLIVLSALAPSIGDPRTLRWLAVLALAGQGGVFLAMATDVPSWVGFVGATLRVLYLLLAAGLILADVLRAGLAVTADKILGAICAYLLFGFAFALVYALVYEADPGAFAVANASAGPGGGMDLFTYFSFVTLSTLGYGDVTPTAPLVRSLVVLETVLGQFYIALVVARLVALHVMREEPAGRGGARAGPGRAPDDDSTA